MVVITVLCPALDSEGVVQLLLGQFQAQVWLTGERPAWQGLTVELSTGRLQITRVTLASEPLRFLHGKVHLVQQIQAMPCAEPKHANMLAGCCSAAPVLLEVTADPPLISGDVRQQAVCAIAAANYGLLSDGQGFYNGAGEVLLDAQGAIEARPDIELLRRFTSLPDWPAKEAETQIDPQQLQARVGDYLRGTGQRRLKPKASLLEATLIRLAVLYAALAQLGKISKFHRGVQALEMLGTPGALPEADPQIPLGRPELLMPVILASVRQGKDGHALAVGGFDPATQADLDFLSLRARQLGTLYTYGSDDPRDAETLAVLKDDAYRAYRRRPVPARYAGDRPLVLFDVKIDPELARGVEGGGVFYLFAAATPEEGGGIVQLPWSLVAPESFTFAPPRVTHPMWGMFRRVAILSAVGAVVVGALYLGLLWLTRGTSSSERRTPVAARPSTGLPLSFRRWAFDRNEMGRPGYFISKNGVDWEEWQADPAKPGSYQRVGVWLKSGQTPDYIELFATEPEKQPLWIRLGPVEAGTSRDHTQWTHSRYGGPRE